MPASSLQRRNFRRRTGIRGAGLPIGNLVAGSLSDVVVEQNVAVAISVASVLSVGSGERFGPLVFSLDALSGALQTGLTLNAATGIISGTPTESAARTLIVNVSNNAPSNVQVTFIITVSDGVPEAFSVGDWTVTDDTTGGSVTVNVLALPNDSGSPLTAIQYKIDDGLPQASGISAIDSFQITGLADDTQIALELVAVNAVGSSADSDIKTVTPTTSISNFALFSDDPTDVANAELGGTHSPIDPGGFDGNPAWADNGTVTATQLPAVGGVFPISIAGGEVFARRDRRGISITSGLTYDIEIVTKDGDGIAAAGQVKYTFKNGTGAESVATHDYNSYSVMPDTDLGTFTVGSLTSDQDDTTRAFLTFASTITTNDFRIGVSTGLADLSKNVQVYLASIREEPQGPPAIPDPFIVSQWTVINSGTGGTVTVNVSSLPDDNNSPITAIQFRVDGGSYQNSGISGTGSFDITGLTDDVPVTVELRPVNGIGNGPDSDVKNVTPTTSSFQAGGTGGKTASSFIYVSPAGSDANTTIHGTFLAAKAAPMQTISAAIARQNTTTGCAVVVGPGQYFESVEITGAADGTAANNNFLVSETDRGAEIVGNATGQVASPITLRASHYQVHNFLLTGRAAVGTPNDDKPVAGIKVEYPDPAPGGNLAVNSVRIAGLSIRGSGLQRVKTTKAREVDFFGNFVERRAGDANGGVAWDMVTHLDSDIRWNTFRGNGANGGLTADAGLYIKGWSSGLLVDSNDIIADQAGGSETVALKVGDLGFSRENREFPFGGSDPAIFAEMGQSTVTNNRLETNFDEATHFRGADQITYGANWHKAGVQYARTLNGIGGRWDNQATTVPAEFSTFVTYEPGTQPTGDRFVMGSRRITQTEAGWRATGTAGTVSQHAHAGTNSFLVPAIEDNHLNVLSGTVGEGGWDRSQVLVDLGISAASAPDAFTVGQWSIADAGSGGTATVTVSALPNNNGASITAIQFKVGAGAYQNSGIATTGDFDITGLTDGVSASVQIRPVNSAGNGADSDVKNVTTTTGASAPDAFAIGDWSVVDEETGGALTVTIASMPATNGSATTDIRYSVNGGSSISSGLTATGSFDITGLADGVSSDISLFHVNAIGTSAESDTKSATPFGKTFSVSLGGGTISSTTKMGFIPRAEWASLAAASGDPAPNVGFNDSEGVLDANITFDASGLFGSPATRATGPDDFAAVRAAGYRDVATPLTKGVMDITNIPFTNWKLIAIVEDQISSVAGNIIGFQLDQAGDTKYFKVATPPTERGNGVNNFTETTATSEATADETANVVVFTGSGPTAKLEWDAVSSGQTIVPVGIQVLDTGPFP